MHKLIIEDDEGKTTVVPLIRDEITIGRKEGNTIRLTERNISRRHAKIVRSNGAVYIEDLGSYNGIKVNGARVNGKAGVNEGDRVQIGDYQIALKVDKQEADPFADQRTIPLQRDDTPVPQAARATVPGLTAAAPSPAPPQPPSIPQGPPPTPPMMPPVPGMNNGAGSMPLPPPGARSGTALIMPNSAADPTQRIDLARLTPGLQPDAPGKLVALTTEHAGREFVLDKGTMVIGRTDDNDITVDHRSISRHHAKIVREGGRYSIVDLQSANGVRVNGEEYGKVELRRGDIIDLGHVRMRYVEAGEAWVFTGVDSTLPGAPIGKKGGKGLMIGLIVGGVAVVAIIIAVVASGHKGSPQPVVTNTNPPQQTQQNPPPPPPSNPQVAQLLDQADKQRSALDWDGELTTLGQILAIQPNYSPALDMQTKAQAEKANAATYDKFTKAAGASQYDTAVAEYNQIPADSVYQAQGAASFAQVKQSYLQAHLGKLQDDVTAKNCPAARKEQTAVEVVDPGNATAAGLVASCTAPPGGNPPGGNPPGGNPPGGNPPGGNPPGGNPPPAACDAAALGNDAKAALAAHDYATASSKGYAALKCPTGDKSNAWLAIGVAACVNSDGKTAKQAIDNVDPGRAGYIKNQCDHYETDLPP
jgi:pSer/pThr/pTyr-binding forkhead associated (FHA) protein